MSKKTAPAPLPGTDAEVETLIRDVIAAQIELEKHKADRDAAVIEAASPYAAAIAEKKAVMDAGLETLERWSAAHKDRFGDKKSLTLGGARFGWRLGNWQTKLKGKTKWDTVVTTLQDLIAAADRANAGIQAVARKVLAEGFLRIKTEPNKERMIEMRDDDAAVELLTDLGVKIEQESTFYVSPDREGQDGPELTR